VAAKEGCTWWLNGPIQIQQSNGVAVNLMLQQKPDGALLGTGEYDVGLVGGKSSGSLDGEVKGDNVQFNIFWAGGNAVGEYNGSINSRGRMEGTTRDRFHPESTAQWYSTKLLTCLLGGVVQRGNPDEKKAAPKPKDPSKGIESPGKFFQH
jgi:hypothetical protein